jgi:8-oxo-dGTP pyrophosphatase MutT (NUDIX family)
VEERFDILDEHGCPTGRTDARSEVHARGYWHRAFHLFICGRWSGADRAILQIRSGAKDVGAGKIDVAVGGHFRAGESLSEVVREAEEEIGLRVRSEDLTALWTQAAEHVQPGIVDREWQEVFLLRRDAPPSAYAPDPGELAGLIAVPLADLVAVLEGRLPRAEAEGLFWEDRAWRPGRRAFGRADFIAGDEENLLRAARWASEWLVTWNG